MPGAVVEFYRADGGFAGYTALAGTNGLASVNDVKPGTYWVKFTAPAARQDLEREEWWQDAASHAAATPITLTAGLDAATYTAELNTATPASPGRVSGQVLDAASNRPISGATVYLLRDGTLPGYKYVTFTDEDGRYSFVGVPFDDWAVRATHINDLYFENYAGSSDGSYVEAVTLTSATPTAQNVDVSLAPRGLSISGTVYGAGGHPVTNGRVSLHTSIDGPPIAETLIQWTGRYSFTGADGLASGTYYVRANVGENSYYASAWSVSASGDPRPLSLDAPNQAISADIELMLRPLTAVDDAYTTPTDTPLTTDHPENGVLANDSGYGELKVIGLQGTYIGQSGTEATAAGGEVTAHDYGGFTYTPPAGFAGIDTFTYMIYDARISAPATATVSITVGNPHDGDDDGDNDSDDTGGTDTDGDDTGTGSNGGGPDEDGSDGSDHSPTGGDALATTGSTGFQLGWAAALGAAFLAAGGVLFAGHKRTRGQGQ